MLNPLILSLISYTYAIFRRAATANTYRTSTGISAVESPDARPEKINLEKVLASLATPCSNCGYRIPPAELLRVSTNKVRCPKCGVTFTTGASA